ncbi:histidinol phosphate aminotransferase apoenzyme [Malonomonas rubra DSM 5091]|uniref:Histidinol-phosphate aminotransferase n=1 Tax=Malonomonas rubra DSM 5091 TaxID=1122189 RepID=A0A1M6HKS9_MALRU|nr:histidinol-phosphate transaminase [Malonomonas rubra]SHJ22765.1 histidinol phosphate aminotransferase apoenzyme [Malonomonas rubra DSM 5091]
MLPLRKNIAEMAGYVPGFQPQEDGWIKLNTNENPYPPSAKVREAIIAELGAEGESLRKYPDAASKEARAVAARLYKVDPEWVIMANGSDELLNNLIRAFAGEGEEVGYIHPSYSYYATLTEIQGAKIRTFGLTDDFKIADFPERYEGKLFFLTSPNAPLGFIFDNAYIEELAQRCAGVLVVDEAYVDFADSSAMQLVKKHENIVVTRTFSKSYSLAGMRLGLAVARPEVIAALDKIRDHYHLDRLALVAATAALEDQEQLRLNVDRVCNVRDCFSNELRKLGYEVIPSHGNFVFAVPSDRDGKRVYDALFERKILVRYFSDPLLKHGLRITIGTREEMMKIKEALTEIG